MYLCNLLAWNVYHLGKNTKNLLNNKVFCFFFKFSRFLLSWKKIQPKKINIDSYHKYKTFQEGISIHTCNQFYCHFYSKTCIFSIFGRKNWAMTLSLYFQEGKFITNRLCPKIFFVFHDLIIIFTHCQLEFSISMQC